MKTRRVYVEGLDPSAAEVRLSEDRSRYVARVLRMRVGDPLNVFDGRGKEVQGVISSAAKAAVVVELQSPVDALAQSPCAITLVQGISRGDRMDFTLQKATELGVHAICVCFAERSEVRLTGKRLQSRMEHWHGVIVSAAEQCGRADMPELTMIDDMATAVADACRWILDGGARVPLTDRLREGSPVDACSIAVGPEGGWTENELAAALRTGWEAVCVGPRTLRSETAGPAVIAAIQAAWGDW